MTDRAYYRAEWRAFPRHHALTLSQGLAVQLVEDVLGRIGLGGRLTYDLRPNAKHHWYHRRNHRITFTGPVTVGEALHEATHAMGAWDHDDLFATAYGLLVAILEEAVKEKKGQ